VLLINNKKAQLSCLNLKIFFPEMHSQILYAESVDKGLIISVKSTTRESKGFIEQFPLVVILNPVFSVEKASTSKK